MAEIELKKILDVDKFLKDVERMVFEGATYLDAVLFWCERNEIEIETIASFIKKNENLRTKILAIATKNKLMKKEEYEGSTLPI